MNPTLFDRVVEAETKIRNGKRPGPDAPDLLEKRLAALPKARASDPQTSHEAAAVVKPGNGALIQAIRQVVGWSQPATAFEIAQHVDLVYPRRWSDASVRTAVSRAGLRAVDTEGRSPRGQRCIRYSL